MSVLNKKINNSVIVSAFLLLKMKQKSIFAWCCVDLKTLLLYVSLRARYIW